MATMLEEIQDSVSLEMKFNDIEDNTKNRLRYLTKLKNRWLVNNASPIEKKVYLMILNIEILNLELMLEKNS